LRSKIAGDRSKIGIGQYGIPKLTTKEKQQVKGKTLPATVRAKLAEGNLDYEIFRRIIERRGRGIRANRAISNLGSTAGTRRIAKTRTGSSERARRAVDATPANGSQPATTTSRVIN
jgi:hypothetical protein